MTLDQKNTWLYYLQCKYSTWSTKFNASLSYGQCIDTFIENNISISNLFGPMHRYIPFTSTVTNAFSLTAAELIVGTNVTISFTLNGYAISYIGPNSVSDIMTYILGEINSNTATHTYVGLLVGDTINLYTYDTGETFADIPVISIVENDVGLDGASVSTTTSTLEDDLSVILNIWNCLTLEQICAVKTKLNSLLGNCNCN